MRSSLVIAGAIALGLGAWLASPYIDLERLGLKNRAGAEDTVENAQPQTVSPPAKRLTSVRVQTLTAEPVTREIVIDGYTEPDRVVELKAQVTGSVEAVPVRRGSRVETDDVVVQLDPRDREAKIKWARAHVEQRQIERTASQRLGEKGFQAETRVAESEALYEQAIAELERARIELDDTAIRAPFEGIFEERYVEVGDYLDIGDPVAQIIDNDPLVVIADVPETTAGHVHEGMTGHIRLVSGLELEGRVGYVAAHATDTTRTFRIELDVDNPEGKFPAGVSASVTLKLGDVQAHKVSSGLLVLDDQGRLGIKAVDGNDIVRFHPVNIVRTEADSVWLQGLPETLRIITVGQGFVADGQHVETVDATAEAPVAQANESAA